jgi:hypothetical protein
MSSIETQRLVVFHDFESSLPGQDFLKWPQHLTIVPFFTHEGIDRDDIVDFITDTSQQVDTIIIEPFELVMYGLGNDRPATKVRDTTGELMRLHNSLVNGLSRIGCTFESLDYSLDNYSPHVRQQSHNLLSPNPYTVDSVTIAAKLPKSVERHKTIIDKIKL